MHRSVISPPTNQSLAWLLEVQANHYRGRAGQDYCAHEVDDLIIRRRDALLAKHEALEQRAREEAERVARNAIASMRKRLPTLAGIELYREMSALRSLVEQVSGQETCPFRWALLEQYTYEREVRHG